eukprot:Awhi_evm2s5696
MLPKKHVVKHELPVPEGQFATGLPVSDKDYIVAGTKLWKGAPLDASYFDISEFLQENMNAMVSLAPRRMENLAIILVQEIKQRCLHEDSIYRLKSKKGE